MKKVHIGTSGWHYKHWAGVFYPEDVPADEWLEFYTRRFDTVEINNSFYRLPERKTLDKWRKTAVRDFIFSVKASRYITHMKKLKDPRRSTAKFLKSIEKLGKTAGPVLFQLPPRFRYNAKRLASFLDALPGRYRYAFEFRDPSWQNNETYQILKEHGAAFCIFDIGGRLAPRKVTADFAYIRLHGPGEAYRGSYGTKALAGWAGAISSWKSNGKEVFCYFDNDRNGYAPRNADALNKMLLT